MPESIVPPTHLTSSARRALAASAIRAATDLPALCAQLTADQLDAASAAILAAAGVDDAAALATLAALWGDR